VDVGLADFLRRAIMPWIHRSICSGSESSLGVWPVAAVSKMMWSYSTPGVGRATSSPPAPSMIRLKRSKRADSSAPGEIRAMSI